MARPPYWVQFALSCDACGEPTRRRCGCGKPLCVDCREHSHADASKAVTPC